MGQPHLFHGSQRKRAKPTASTRLSDMLWWIKTVIALVLAFALFASCQGRQHSRPSPPALAEASPAQGKKASISTSPDVGVICTWALVANAAAVGRKCPGKFNPDVQPILEQSEADLAAYILRNSNIGEAGLANMRRVNTGAEDRVESLCEGFGLRFHDGLVADGGKALRQWTAEQTAIDRPASWGTCL